MKKRYLLKNFGPKLQVLSKKYGTFGYLTELITSKNQMSIHTTFTQEVLHTFYGFYGKNYFHLHTKPYFTYSLVLGIKHTLISGQKLNILATVQCVE